MSAPVDVLARKVLEEYSRAGGNPPDAHFDRNAAEQWMAHALEFAGVAELIEAAEYGREWIVEAGDRKGLPNGGTLKLIDAALARVKGGAA